MKKNSFEKIRKLCQTNMTTLHNAENIVSALKKKIVHSYKNITNYSLSYEKESQSLKDNLNQVYNSKFSLLKNY